MSLPRPIILAAGLAVAAGLLLSGCGNDKSGNTGSTATGTAQKVFNYINVDEPKHLDPAYSYDVYEGIASGLLFDGLVNFGTGSDVIPGLAEKWDVSDDGTSYTFHLRGAKFSNGKAVTSADVRYSFTRLLLPATNSDRKWVVGEIAGSDEVSSGTANELSGLQTPDARTVVIKLKKPYPPFLAKIAMPSGAIIPDGMASTPEQMREFDKNPVGAGPWMLDKWMHDQRLEFKPNEHYWNRNRIHLDRFIYHVQVDDSVQRQQFKVGRIDQYTVGFTAYTQWIKDPAQKTMLVEVPELNTYFVAFMHSKPALKDRRVRQAISHAINKKKIFERLQLSRGTLAHGPVPPGIKGYREDVKGKEYDPAKAKALLDQAGVKELNLKYWIRSEAQTDEIAAAIRADLEKIGVHVEIVRRDLASHREGIYNGEPDLYSNSWWLDYADIESALEPPFHSRNIPRKGNGCRFQNEQFEALIAQAEAEANPDKRIALYQQAEDVVIEECAWFPMYHRKSFTAVQPWIKNFVPELMINAGKFTDIDIDLTVKK